VASPEQTTPPGSDVGPNGTQAVAFHSDLRCPWARLAIHRLTAAAERRGVRGEMLLDHRWFPLGDDAIPSDGAVLDREVAAIGALVPELGWTSWADADRAFPASSRRAAGWVQAAKAVGPQASVELDLALREALWADGADLEDDDELARIAGTVDLVGPQA